MISDPDGAFLTLTREEGERLLELLHKTHREEGDLGGNLESLRSQLGEWVG